MRPTLWHCGACGTRFERQNQKKNNVLPRNYCCVAVSHLAITVVRSLPVRSSALDIVADDDGEDDDTQYGARIEYKLRKFMVGKFYRAHMPQRPVSRLRCRGGRAGACGGLSFRVIFLLSDLSKFYDWLYFCGARVLVGKHAVPVCRRHRRPSAKGIYE